MAVDAYAQIDGLKENRPTLRIPWVRIVYFNDDKVPKALGTARVTTVAGHNDHFHVELWPRHAS